MKMVGEMVKKKGFYLCLSFYLKPPSTFQYLHETLTPFIHTLLENEEDCEVDPTKMQPGASHQHNKDSLVRLVKRAWVDILSSYTKFPRLKSNQFMIHSSSKYFQ